MTAGGINRVIAQMKADGRTSAIVICPVCEGGTRKRRTLSVDLRDGMWLYLCHRGSCPVKGAVPAIGNDGRPIAEGANNFTSRPLTDATRLPTYGGGDHDADPIGRKLYGDSLTRFPGTALIDRGLYPFALHHGLRVLVNNPGTHVWEVRNARGIVIGNVTRTEDKRVLTWREVDSSWYGCFSPESAIKNRMDICIIVEDPLSAALLAEEGFRAIALHGTSISREAATEIITSFPALTFLIALDSDEAGRKGSQTAMDRLRMAGASKVWQWLLPKDVHSLTILERRELAKNIEETLAKEAAWTFPILR